MRRFEKGDRFWAVQQVERKVIVRYGKVGKNERTERKAHRTKGAAVRDLEKRVAAKLRQGWVEVQAHVVATVDLAPRVEGLKTAAVHPVAAKPVRMMSPEQLQAELGRALSDARPRWDGPQRLLKSGVRKVLDGDIATDEARGALAAMLRGPALVDWMVQVRDVAAAYDAMSWLPTSAEAPTAEARGRGPWCRAGRPGTSS